MDSKNLKTHVELPFLVFTPNDLMEGLMMAVAMEKCEPVYASSNDLKIYKLYDDNNCFWGTCYALKVDDVFYANIQGTTQIISFDENTFKLIKTDELWLPIEVKNEDIMFVVCKFEQLENGYMIYPLSIKKAIKPNLTDVCDVHTFNERISVIDAMKYYKENFLEK